MLYPQTFREEYGQELQSVFDLSVEEASEKGGLEVEKLVWRELVSLPKAVFLEHLRERRNTMMNRGFDAYFEFASGSWKEFLTVLLPFFLVGGLMPVLNILGRAGVATNAVRTVIMLGLFGLFLLLLALGVMKGLPRWSMPYLGFFMAILSTYLFSAIFGTPLYFLFGTLRDQSLLIIDIIWDGIFWYGLLTAILVLIIVSRRFPTFQQFRTDWTLLCFIVYGAVPFAIWITFDEYAGDEPYMFFSFLVLAVGAWFYLRSPGEWTRFGMLFIALTLAFSITSAAKAVLVPVQDWPFVIDQGLVRAEVRHTITIWGWFVVGMLLPLAARLLPQSDRASHPTVAEG
jgi:hypothetical protein